MIKYKTQIHNNYPFNQQRTLQFVQFRRLFVSSINEPGKISKVQTRRCVGKVLGFGSLGKALTSLPYCATERQDSPSPGPWLASLSHSFSSWCLPARSWIPNAVLMQFSQLLALADKHFSDPQPQDHTPVQPASSKGVNLNAEAIQIQDSVSSKNY